MNKPIIYRITATHPKTQLTYDLYYPSIKEAKRRNPYLINFEYKESTTKQ